MKAKLLILTSLFLFSLTSMARNVECVQSDGDDYYQVKFDGEMLAILYTVEEKSSLIYTDAANILDGNIIFNSRYHVNLSSGTLVRFKGKSNTSILTEILECEESTRSLNAWIKDNL